MNTKKRIAALLILVPLIMAGLTVLGVHAYKTAYEKAQDRNRAISTALNDCVADYVKYSDSEMLQRLTQRSFYGITQIKKSKTAYRVTLSVKSKDYGSEIKRFNESNNKYLSASQMRLDHLALLSSAKEVEREYVITAEPDGNGYKINLTPEFINAYLGYVYDDKAMADEAFLKTAVEGFDDAIDIYVDLEYSLEDIDKILKEATTLAKYEQKIYYSVYKSEKSVGGEERFSKELRRYNIETHETETVYKYEDYLEGFAYSLNYIDCLENGALISAESLGTDGTFGKSAYIYDYKTETLSEIKCSPDLSVFASALYADYRDGTVYVAEGQDGAGDIRRFTADDETAETAVSAGDGYLYLNSLFVNDGKVYMCLLDSNRYESSGYTDRVYNVFFNDGKAVGEKVISDIDGKVYFDGNDGVYFFRNGTLYKHNIKTNEEKKLTEELDLSGAEVRLLAGNTAYTLYSENGSACLCRINLKNGKAKQLSEVSNSVVTGY